MSFVLDTAEQLTDAIDAMVEEICPNAGRLSMYGGILFERDAGNPKSIVCGHFIYTNHVNLEFANGYKLQDPKSVLEGKGKYRRHIKLTSLDELRKKSVRSMLKRAFS